MKSILFAFILALSLNSNGQPVVVDIALGNMYFTDVSGSVTLNANTLVINVPVLLHLPVYNPDQGQSIPANATTIRVGLNTNLIMDPSYNLTTAPLSEYYTWSVVVGSQTQIFGTPQYGAIPPDLLGEAVFRVIPNTLGGPKTLTANFNIADASLLNDPNSSNNSPNLQYTVVAAPAPVDFISVSASRRGCSIGVNFRIENQVNVDKYEIETSKDGVHFVKVAELKAENKTNYFTDFGLTNSIRATSIFVRVKSVDFDGSYGYSETRAVSGICDAALVFNIYPNPAVGKDVSIRATSGIFNGKYKLVVMDMAGRLVNTKEVVLTGVTQYTFDLSRVTAGKYILKMINLEGTESGVIPFEKF